MDQHGGNTANEVLQIALQAIQQHGLMAPTAAPIVLMVSGGSDSTAMCLLMHELCQQGVFDPQLVTVLHINHGLRGADADGDAEFVRKLAGLCGFAYEMRRIDIAARLDQFDGNVENAGRHLRYEQASHLLDLLCDSTCAPREDGRLWVAHTLDDRTETFFMRTIVGTGPGGLVSIRYSNDRVVRPLLGVTRQQLRSYIGVRVNQLGWQLDPPDAAQAPGGLWREDATNYDTTGFRSFVRHRLVPLAQQRNPRLQLTLSRTIDLATDESDFLDRLVQQLRAQCVRHRVVDGRQQTLVDLQAAGDADRVLMRRLVHAICKEMLPPSSRIEQKHIESVVNQGVQPGFSMDLPGGVSVRNVYGTLVFSYTSDGNEHLSRRVVGGAFGTTLEEAASETGLAGLDNIADDADRGVLSDIASSASGADARDDVTHVPVPGSTVVRGGLVLTVSDVPADALTDGGGAAVDAAAYARQNATERRIYVDRDLLLQACSEAAANSLTQASADDAPLQPTSPSPASDSASRLSQPCLQVTTRRDGDVVCPLGMHGAHKKLSDVLVDNKVERALRDRALVVRAGSHIVWVPGVVVDHRFKASADSHLLCIAISKA